MNKFDFITTMLQNISWNSVVSGAANLSIPVVIVLTFVGVTCIMFHKCYVQLIQAFVAVLGVGSFKRGLCVLLVGVSVVFILGFGAGMLSDFSFFLRNE